MTMRDLVSSFLLPLPTATSIQVALGVFMLTSLFLVALVWYDSPNLRNKGSQRADLTTATQHSKGINHAIILTPSTVHPYGIAEMQGKRSYMEDRHLAVAHVNGNPHWSIYAVFDGHGGDHASSYCQEHFGHNLSMEASLLVSNPKEALTQAFLQTDHDYHLRSKLLNYNDGTTACVALVQHKKIFVANAGDSRAILIQASGRIHPLSCDHKPDRVDEKARIETAGGFIQFYGVWRVQGVLALSRAIGDRLLKPFVIPTPEVTSFTTSSFDHYLVLATDGVWDVLSNQQVGTLVSQHPQPQDACNVIMEKAYACGSQDNICVMVVDLQHATSSSSRLAP